MRARDLEPATMRGHSIAKPRQTGAAPNDGTADAVVGDADEEGAVFANGLHRDA
jgi:hypothetical protein